MLKAACFYDRLGLAQRDRCLSPIEIRDGKLVCWSHGQWLKWSTERASGGADA